MLSKDKYPTIRLSCISTSDAEPMLIRFLSGVEDTVEVACHSVGLPGKRGLGGGQKLWEHKTQLLIDACCNNNYEFEVFSDIDITFYRPWREKIPKIMDGYDICFQREWALKSAINIGFIVFRANIKVRRFWEKILEKIQKDGMWDQEATNQLAHDDDFLSETGLKIGFLPDAFWAYSQGVLPREDCVLHHANCSSKTVKKWLQMNVYRPLFQVSEKKSYESFKFVVENINNTWVYGSLNHRKPKGEIIIDNFGNIENKKGDIKSKKISIVDKGIFLHQEGEKILAFLDEFYYDSHRCRILCVGRYFPKDFLKSQATLGFFFMHASILNK